MKEATGDQPVATAGPDRLENYLGFRQAGIRSAVEPQLTAARDALVAKMPTGALRDALAGDIYSPAAHEALETLHRTDPGLHAAAALSWAIMYAKAGYIGECSDWCARVADVVEAPAFPATGIPRAELVWVDEDDDISTGTAQDLANDLEVIGLGATSDIRKVYAAQRGALVEVEWKITGTDFDENNYSTRTVTVTLPHGDTITGSWQVDGET